VVGCAQTANPLPVRGKQACAAERTADSLRESREADKVALASGTHLPQQVPTPSSRVRSRKFLAPSFTADLMCLSETALQTHMIMPVL
jgi:hypothetical protein